MRDWFDNPAAFPEFTVKCESKSFLVHRIVLCARSEWFEKALTGGFVESGASKIELHEDDEDIVQYMLRYCYTLDIPDGLVNHVKYQPLSFLVHLHAAAEKYVLPHLARLCADIFGRHIINYPASPVLATASRDVYTITSDIGRRLRDSVIAVVLRYSGQLLSSRDDHAELHNVSTARQSCHCYPAACISNVA